MGVHSFTLATIIDMQLQRHSNPMVAQMVGHLSDCVTADGRRAHLTAHAGLYHDVCDAASLNLLVPDLVVASHPGMHDHRYTASWMPTLRRFRTLTVPILFTGFTGKESIGDAAVLRTAGFDEADFVAPVARNPWRGLQPFCDMVDNEFYYTNDSFFVVHRRKAAD
jgi:hypothetical protein